MCAGLVTAADPVRTVWIMSGVSGGAARPDVHSVSIGERSVTVQSAGVSLKYFGPLQMAPVPVEAAREFQFEIPLHPAAETGRHVRVPADVIGTFVNGLPIYNQFEALSWSGSNLWHYDAVALSKAPAGLLEQLIPGSAKHSPLIGFALDGFPVYGPRSYVSSYRLRAITQRRSWPDGTVLTPEQYGPDVTPADPLGTYAEDYEYVAGSGDLDEFNGRFVKTPEYPEGTYAYFMTNDGEGKLAFPYLIGPRFYGHVPQPTMPWYPIGTGLSATVGQIHAGQAVTFRIEAARRFEYVHEKPVHFLIASEDLAEFAHIHPELAADDSYQVSWTFAHGGRYRVWLDYSLPGEAPRVDAFDLTLAGASRVTEEPAQLSSLCVKVSAAKPLRAGVDIPITLGLSGETDSLQPYLGAWAHVIVIGEHWHSFAHAHPVEQTPGFSFAHTHAIAGPAPNEIHIVTNFPAAGMYKMWAQFQQGGKVITVPFVLHVAAAEQAKPAGVIPPNAVRIQVSQHGYAPARLEIPANKAMTLAFTRDTSPSCGSEIVFPSLGIRKAIAPGSTVLVALPAQAAGEISFSCGMGMFKGMVVAR
jgi:hypothetical protein